jgi:hypothetical protein
MLVGRLRARDRGDHEALGIALEARLAGGVEARPRLGQPPVEQLAKQIASHPLALSLQEPLDLGVHLTRVRRGEIHVLDHLLNDRECRVARLFVRDSGHQTAPDLALADPERVHEVSQRHARPSPVGGRRTDEEQVLARDRTTLRETAHQRLEVEPDVLADALDHRGIRGAVGGDLLLHGLQRLVEDPFDPLPEALHQTQDAGLCLRRAHDSRFGLGHHSPSDRWPLYVAHNERPEVCAQACLLPPQPRRRVVG